MIHSSRRPNRLPFIQQPARDRLPLLQGVDFDYHRVGLVSYSVDFQPNIGPVEALPGLYLATNFNSGGFGYHPVFGLLVAEFIVDGKTRIDASEFSPDRFKEFDTQAYLEREVTYSEMKGDISQASTTRQSVRERH